MWNKKSHQNHRALRFQIKNEKIYPGQRGPNRSSSKYNAFDCTTDDSADRQNGKWEDLNEQ